MKRRRLTAPTPADLIVKIRKAEGWARIEGDGLATIRRAKEAYEITATGTQYVATPKP